VLVSSKGEDELYEKQFIYTTTGETISFSEDKKRWVTFYSYLPEMMLMTSAGLVSFKDGVLWKHDVGSNYNKFYGTQYTSQVKVVSNVMPLGIKFFHGVVVDSNTAWSCPGMTNLFADQETELSAADFELKEGVWYAAMLRDKNTPNVSDPLIEGDRMRDYVLITTFESDSVDYVRLISVGVRSEPSMLTMN
jgi:hypothetical protein